MLQALIIAVIALLVGADQLTKWLAQTHLMDGPAVLIPGVFEFKYSTNSGIAFGMFQDKTELFSIITVVVLAVILGVLVSGRFFKGRFATVSAILVVAGGIGNLIDRVFRGEVIDFLYFKLINFAIFNVADCFVVIGCGMLIFYFIFLYKEDSDTKLSSVEAVNDCADNADNSDADGGTNG